jgi:hypothetical protein
MLAHHCCCKPDFSPLASRFNHCTDGIGFASEPVENPGVQPNGPMVSGGGDQISVELHGRRTRALPGFGQDRKGKIDGLRSLLRNMQKEGSLSGTLKRS